MLADRTVRFDGLRAVVVFVGILVLLGTTVLVGRRFAVACLVVLVV